MVFNWILDRIFPTECPVCSKSSKSHLYNPLCQDCWKEIKKYNGPSCRICGIPAISEYTITCSTCLKTPPPFSQVIYYSLYEGNLKRAIHLFKFHKIRRLASPLAKLLLQLPIPKVDYIIPVPLHVKRLREREFNQTALLCRFLGKELNIKVLLNELIKTKETTPQALLDRERRIESVKNAFIANKDKINGCHILLVDDVITSGATISECSRALRRAGVKKVTVVALAHSAPADLNA
ncbi:MAG: ComF family protein [Thermodesulfovibrionales bacterium]|nr:ComF family protein [Thermodesulfovibrionales bacterium]